MSENKDELLFMNEKEETTVLEQALKLAMRTRELIINNGGLENCLLGFYSVAQTLGRTNEMAWVENEINGYADTKEIPKYRASVFRNVMADGEEVKVDESFNAVKFIDGILKTEHLLKAQVNYTSLLATKAVTEAKRIKPLGRNFQSSIPWSELGKIISGVKLEMTRKLNEMISEITFERIPQQIFKEFQERVDKKLADSNPQAVSAINKAYESLGMSEDPERIAQVSLACRRLIKHVADMVFPASSQGYTMKDRTPIDVSEDKTLNRLAAYVDSTNPKNKESLLNEINLLRTIYSGDESLVNKGIHSSITNAEAKRMVLFTYITLGDVILLGESNKI